MAPIWALLLYPPPPPPLNFAEFGASAQPWCTSNIQSFRKLKMAPARLKDERHFGSRIFQVKKIVLISFLDLVIWYVQKSMTKTVYIQHCILVISQSLHSCIDKLSISVTCSNDVYKFSTEPIAFGMSQQPTQTSTLVATTGTIVNTFYK